ncbi:claudin-18 [Hoplias malabaricus]|uniref:claudin-18 n=1 Tax=Hoplias malabaricus TaxID=27720 RepID=UPI003462D1A3
MANTILQNAGFVLGLIGTAAIIAATAMNNWSTTDRQGDVVTTVYTYKGLWQDCEVASSGFTECRPMYGLLGYSGQFQAVRALMVVGIVMGVIATGISLFSLKCFKIGSTEDTTKAKMTLTAGIMFLIAGLCAVVAASVYANQIVASFVSATYNSYNPYNSGMGDMAIGMGGMSTATTYTFGTALFVAWVGGGVLVIGGVLKCVAFKGMYAEYTPTYKAVAYKVPAQSADGGSEKKTREQKYV